MSLPAAGQSLPAAGPSYTQVNTSPVSVYVVDAISGRKRLIQAPAANQLPITTIQGTFGLTNIRLAGRNEILCYSPAGVCETVRFEAFGTVTIVGDKVLQPHEQQQQQQRHQQVERHIAQLQATVTAIANSIGGGGVATDQPRTPRISRLSRARMLVVAALAGVVAALLVVLGWLTDMSAPFPVATVVLNAGVAALPLIVLAFLSQSQFQWAAHRLLLTYGVGWQPPAPGAG